MKKTVLLGFVLGTLALSSCKKDWTCNCEVVVKEAFQDIQGVNPPSEYQIEKSSKNEAKESCDKTQLSLRSNELYESAECDLK